MAERGSFLRAWSIVGLGAACLLLAGEWVMTSRAFTNHTNELAAIYGNAIPSIEHLAATLDEIHALRREMRLLTNETLSEESRREAAARVASGLARARLHAAAYKTYPTFNEEAPLQARMDHALDGLQEAAEAVLGTRPETTREVARERFGPATDQAYATVNELVRFNAREAADTAQRVYGAQATAASWTLWLMLTFVAIALVLWFLAEQAVRRFEREREERMAELDGFAGRVAHDLKAPLTAIVFGIGTLKKDGGTVLSEASRTALAREGAAVERMTALIDDLLAFARAGGKPDARASAGLEAILSGVHATLKPLLEAHRARLSVEVEKGLAVGASPGVVASILQNLVRNGVLYLGDSETREVTVSAHARGSSAVIEVSDTGPGIPDDLRRRLFRPFERGDSGVDGHGLGLATVKRLVQGHGGQVELLSSATRGSTFRVTLRLALPAEATQPVALSPA
jgi:signal transduction histidine kinase